MSVNTTHAYSCVRLRTLYVVIEIKTLHLFHKTVKKETDLSDFDNNNCVYFIVRQTRSQNLFIIRVIQ